MAPEYAPVPMEASDLLKAFLQGPGGLPAYIQFREPKRESKAYGYCSSGNAFAKGGKLKSARGAYNLALLLDPKNADLFYNEGAALFNAGLPKGDIELLEQAAEAFGEATGLDGKDAEALECQALAFVALGRLKDDAAWFDKAFESFRRSSSLDPKNTARRSNYGLVSLLCGKLEKEKRHKVEWFRLALDGFEKITPKDEEVLLFLVDVLIELGIYEWDPVRFKAALAAVDRMLGQENVAHLWTLRGVVLLCIGFFGPDNRKLEEAYAAFRKARQLDPADFLAFNYAGGLLYTLGMSKKKKGRKEDARNMLGKALEMFDTALQIHPRYRPSAESRKDVLRELGSI